MNLYIYVLALVTMINIKLHAIMSKNWLWMFMKNIKGTVRRTRKSLRLNYQSKRSKQWQVGDQFLSNLPKSLPLAPHNFKQPILNRQVSCQLFSNNNKDNKCHIHSNRISKCLKCLALHPRFLFNNIKWDSAFLIHNNKICLATIKILLLLLQHCIKETP